MHSLQDAMFRNLCPLGCAYLYSVRCMATIYSLPKLYSHLSLPAQYLDMRYMKKLGDIFKLIALPKSRSLLLTPKWLQLRATISHSIVNYYISQGTIFFGREESMQLLTWFYLSMKLSVVEEFVDHERA